MFHIIVTDKPTVYTYVCASIAVGQLASDILATSTGNRLK